MNRSSFRSLPIIFMAAASTGFLAAPAHATVLYQVQMHFASGPISLAAGQNASACAVNPDSDPVAILIALLTADSSSLLTYREVTLQPGQGACVSYDRGVPPANQQSPNVYAVVVPNGRLEANTGRIVQDRPGSGGCIVASLQIALAPNNTPGQTILSVQMIKHLEARDENGKQTGGGN
jgi:hypothetical protein